MSLNVEISSRDLQRLKRNLDKMLREDERAVVRIIQGGGLIAETVAARNAPVGTPESTGKKGYIGGTLRQSIRKKSEDKGLTAKVATNVKYARFQNDGTSRGVKAKKFMEKGFKAGAEYVIKKLG